MYPKILVSNRKSKKKKGKKKKREGKIENGLKRDEEGEKIQKTQGRGAARRKTVIQGGGGGKRSRSPYRYFFSGSAIGSQPRYNSFAYL